MKRHELIFGIMEKLNLCENDYLEAVLALLTVSTGKEKGRKSDVQEVYYASER